LLTRAPATQQPPSTTLPSEMLTRAPATQQPRSTLPPEMLTRAPDTLMPETFTPDIHIPTLQPDGTSTLPYPTTEDHGHPEDYDKMLLKRPLHYPYVEDGDVIFFTIYFIEPGMTNRLFEIGRNFKIVNHNNVCSVHLEMFIDFFPTICC
jgi:hypothetical protein